MKSVFTSLCIAIVTLLSAQENEPVMFTFRTTQLINAQTVEMCPVGGPEFNIRHRFGVVGPDSSAYQQFLGLDLPANIRLGFAFPINDRISVGIGRTKMRKYIDSEIKFRLFQQTENDHMPVSVVLYANCGYRAEKFPRLSANSFYGDSTTPFEYTFAHRFAYNSEIIIARKFNDKLSLQVAGSYVYKNLVSPGEENGTMSVIFSGAYNLGLSSSLIFEYAYRFNNRPEGNAYPLAVGWEFGTAGHIFQLLLCSSNEIPEQEVYTINSQNYFKGKFAIGFNIKRIMWRKQK